MRALALALPEVPLRLPEKAREPESDAALLVSDGDGILFRRKSDNDRKFLWRFDKARWPPGNLYLAAEIELLINTVTRLSDKTLHATYSFFFFPYQSSVSVCCSPVTATLGRLSSSRAAPASRRIRVPLR